MRQIAVIETIGSISKYESLSAVENHKLPHTIVLRNTSPFPGYILKNDNNKTFQQTNTSLFLALQYRYAPEKILKLSAQIKQQMQLECDAGYGEIETPGDRFPCIRVKKLQNITRTPDLQEFVRGKGFGVRVGQFGGGMCKIKVYKIFKLLEIHENLFRDYYEREKFYIQIPATIDHTTFERCTQAVKIQLEFGSFDAALGEIYRYNGNEKVIRIYDRDKSLEHALLLKKAYITELRKELITG